MKTILLFILSTNLSAAVMTECGEYRLRGQVKIDDKSSTVELIVLKDTKSEIRLAIPPKEVEKILGLKDYGIEMNAFIKKKMNGMKGELENVSNLHAVALDPVQLHKDIELLKSEKCL